MGGLSVSSNRESLPSGLTNTSFETAVAFVAIEPVPVSQEKKKIIDNIEYMVFLIRFIFMNIINNIKNYCLLSKYKKQRLRMAAFLGKEFRYVRIVTQNYAGPFDNVYFILTLLKQV